MSAYFTKDAGRDVIIIGAGFSKAISNAMPLLNDLSGTAIQCLAEREASPEVPFLEGTHANVELAMTYLSQRHPWLSEVDYLHNRARSLGIMQAIGHEIEQRTLDVVAGPCPPWLQRFVHWLHYRRAVVITLNYDTLLERAFSLIETGSTRNATHYYLAPSVLYPISFRAVQGGMGADAVPTTELLKLHGSTNWRYSGRTSYFGEAIELRPISGWRTDDNERARSQVLTGRVPLLIPPVADKVGYFENEDVHHLWMRAADAIRKAKRIICIGYSLPETDLTMRFLLQSNDPGQPVEFIVVNRDEKAPDHYRTLLPRSFSVTDGFARDDAVPAFACALFSDPFNVTEGAGCGEGSLLQGAVRKHLEVGKELVACETGEKFHVENIDEFGITVLICDTHVPLPLPWGALERVLLEVKQIQETEPHRPYLEISGSGYEDYDEPSSVHMVMSQWVNRASARWATAVLQAAGLVRIESPYGFDVVTLNTTPD